MEILPIQIIDIDQLNLLNKNPRKISEANFNKLKSSIKRDPEFLKLRPILAYQDGESLVIYAGNQRWKACKELGFTEIPVIIDTQANLEVVRSRILLDNIEFGAWDDDLLLQQWSLEELKALDYPELDTLVLKMENSKVEDGENVNESTLKTSDQSISMLGDLYELISIQDNLNHRVLCGDSTDFSQFEKLSDGVDFDLVLTDPPYNVNYTGGTKDKLKIMNDSMDDDSFYAFLLEAFKNLYLSSRAGGAIYIFHADSQGANFRNALTESGFKLSQCLVWVKNQLVMGRQDYHWKHEPILYGWKEGAGHDWYSDRSQTTVLEFDKPMQSLDHPTMKPVNILIYLIQNNSKKAQIVADAFLGSGSTLIACQQTGRNCYGLELDPKYMDVVVRRWVTYMQKNNLEYEAKRNGNVLSVDEINQYLQNYGSGKETN